MTHEDVVVLLTAPAIVDIVGDILAVSQAGSRQKLAKVVRSAPPQTVLLGWVAQPWILQAGCASTGEPTKISPIVMDVGKCRTTKSGLRRRIRDLTAVRARPLAFALVAAVTATMVVSTGPAAADQVSGLKAQAAQLAQDLVLEQLQIGAHQQQYAVDGAKLQQDEAEIGATQNQISSDVNRVSRDRKRLEAEAVSAYINMDPQIGRESGPVLWE